MATTNTWGSEFLRFHGIPLEMGEPIEDTYQGHMSAYQTCVWVNKCVNLKMSSVGSVPLWVIDKSKDNEPIENHPATEMMLQQNPLNYVTGSDLHKFSLGDLELNGETYWQLVNNSAGVLKEIYWRPSSMMEPIPDPKAYIGGFKLKNQPGGDVMLSPREVAFFRYPSLMEPLRGMGKVTPAKDAINLDIFATQAAMALQRNGSKPDWMLMNKGGPVAADKQATIGQQIRQWLGGPSNRGKPLVLGGDWDVKTITMSPRDAELVNLKKLTMQEICAIFEVAPELAGSTDHSTYNNVAEARARFWQDTMIPWMDWYADQMTRQILRRLDPNPMHVFGFDYSSIEGLAEDTNKVWDRFLQLMDRVNVAVERRTITPNGAGVILGEAARELGLDDAQFKVPVPGGDTFYVHLNEIPIEEANLQANIDYAAARGNAAALQPTLGAESEQPQDVGVDATDKPSNIVPLRASYEVEYESKAVGPDPKRVRDSRLAKHQDKAVRGLKKEFQRQQTEALRTLRSQELMAASVEPGFDVKAALSKEEWYNRQKAQGELSGIVGDLTESSLYEAVDAASADYGLSVTWSAVNPKLDGIRTTLGQRITGIDQTTTDSIGLAVENGIKDGMSLAQLAEAVSGVFGTAIDSRSTMIARTESLTAYRDASLVGYREAGIEEVLVYDGEDFDEECADRNGTVVTLDEAEGMEEHPNGQLGWSPQVDAGVAE